MSVKSELSDMYICSPQLWRWFGWMWFVQETIEDKRQALQTAREIRFLSFASVEYQGNIFMTPQDFLESVTEESPRGNFWRVQSSWQWQQ